MLDFLVMLPSMFSGAALWLIISRWMRERETNPDTAPPGEGATPPENVEVQPVAANVLAEPDRLVTQTDSPLPNLQFDSQDSSETSFYVSSSVKMVKCNCGLELPEDSMLEHAESTGHAKPFDLSIVKVGKIWDLEEAVIENASPECTKCGKPVLGLKRIGKTIYVTHLGCSDGKRGDHKQTKTNGQKAKTSTCSICWRSIRGKSGVSQVESLSGQKLMFHEECLQLQSRSQLLADEDPDQRYRRTLKW